MIRKSMNKHKRMQLSVMFLRGRVRPEFAEPEVLFFAETMFFESLPFNFAPHDEQYFASSSNCVPQFVQYFIVIFFDAKSPPRVETEVSHTGFPIWRVKRPYHGFFMLNSTFSHATDCSAVLALVIQL